MKICPDCGEHKSDREFGRNRSRPDGLAFYCRDCFRRRSNAWYRQSREKQGKQVRDHTWVRDGFRWCPTCQKPVTHADYVRSRTTPSGFGSQCKACHKQASSDGYWRRTYGLTKDEVDLLRITQGDQCSICAEAAPEHLDHDHDTGRIRSLLCQPCNNGLGLFRDEPTLLRAAADYVEHHRERAADPGGGTHSGGRRAPLCSPGMVRWRAMQASS